jgi:hypothetical protein
MASILTRIDGQLTVTALAAPAHALPGGALLLRGRSERFEEWILMAPPDAAARVNGEPLPFGLRRIRHRDEIHVLGRFFSFSTECPAKVEPFAGAPGPVTCPRCGFPVELGRPAARCPACRAVHHEDPERPCYSYSGCCAACSAPT